MNDLRPILPPQLEDALQQHYGNSRPESVFFDALEDRLRRRQIELLQEQKKRAMHNRGRRVLLALRTRPLLAVLIALLSLSFLTGIVYALGRLSGFIPGFGFTSEQGQVALLAEAVEVTSGEMRLQALEAVSDQASFWVHLRVSGAGERLDIKNALVELPDGMTLSFLSASDSADEVQGTMDVYLLFPPLPGQPAALTLLLEELEGSDATIPLQLRPVEDGEIMSVPPGQALPLQSETHRGVSLVLDHVAVDAEKTVFQAGLRFDRPHTWLAAQWNVRLTDEDGIPYALQDITPATMSAFDAHIYQTEAFDGSENLLLTLESFPPSESLLLFVDLSADAPAFSLDIPPDARAGQRWELQQQMQAQGLTLKLLRATLTSEPGLQFEIEPGDVVSGVTFYSPDPCVKGSSGGTATQNGTLEANLSLKCIPQGSFEIRLMHIYYRAQGVWQIHWNPPAAPLGQAADTPEEKTPAFEIVPTRTVSAEEPLLQRVQLLGQEYDAFLKQDAGWVHVVEETHSVLRAGQTFPPPYLRSETWTHLDAQGLVLESVHLDFDEAGAVLQQSATRGNVSVNFTTSDTLFNEGIRYPFSMDSFSSMLANALNNGMHVQQDEVPCADGRTCLRLSWSENFVYPGQTEDTDVTGSGVHLWIDVQSGAQLREERVWLSQDGSEKAYRNTEILSVEKLVSPPPDIQNLLSRVNASP